MQCDETWKSLVEYIKVEGLYVFLTKEEVFNVCVNTQNLKQLLEEKYYTMNVVYDDLIGLDQVKKIEEEKIAKELAEKENQEQLNSESEPEEDLAEPQLADNMSP